MAINGALKWSLLFGGGIPVLIALRLGLVFYFAVVSPGWTMHETARILVDDSKFGGRAQARAVYDGDAILPSLTRESRNFEKLNGRNSFWIAEVLGGIKTERSKSIATDLYRRSDRLPHLVGAVALAEAGGLDEKGVNDLIAIVIAGQNEDEEELAMLALGKAHARAAGPILVELLSKDGDGRDYWRHAYACDAVARIGYREAIPVIQSRLRSQKFYDLPNAFRALISLGDREAVPLAIARITPSIQNYNSGFVVNELERVTGRHFGYNKQAWTEWWKSVEHGWSIPEAFRTPFDDQPHIY